MSRQRALWRPYALAGAVAAAAFALLPRGGLAQATLFLAVHASAVAGLGHRVWRDRPSESRVWAVLLGAEAVYLAATAWWYLSPVAFGRALPYPSVLDVMFWTAYLGWAVFLSRLVARQSVGDTAASLDGVVVAVGLAILGWQYLLAPALDAPGFSTAGRVASVVYPVLLLVVAAIAVRLAMVSRHRTVAHVLIGVWVSFELVADVWYSISLADGSFAYGSPWFAAWMLSYTALGALALHPDMAMLTVRSRARPGRGLWRLVALGLAVAGALFVVGVTAGTPDDVGETRALLAAVALMVGVVLFRLGVDISERRRAERDAVRRAATVEAVFAASPDPIVVIGGDGTVWTTSPAARSMLGAADGAWEGRSVLDLVHPDDREAVSAAFARLLAGEVPSLTLRHGLDVPGRGVKVDSHATLLTEGGAVRGAVIVSRDVTAQVDAEHQLRLAKEEAEAANRAKTEFLSRMSHELRTPLNAVLGFAQLLDGDDLPDDARESADQILVAGRHLLALINDVLDIARVESGNFSTSCEPVPVADVVRRAVELVGSLAAERGVRLVVPGDDGVHVHADVQRLTQILINLLGNGIKYNREGGTVALRWARPHPGAVRIEVADTGPGIPPALLPRLFTPFDRLGAETTGVDGVGVGLALSQRLAEAMGGEIAVETRPGAGSTFTLTLPASDDAGAGAGDGGPRRGPRRRREGAATVLHVEDNPANVRLVERILEARPDVEVVAAMQGRAAIEMARHLRPDLVLLDKHLPDMTGREVLAALRSDPATAAVRVVVVSADARPAAVEDLGDADVFAYVTKPLDVDEFLRVVDEALPRAGRRG